MNDAMLRVGGVTKRFAGLVALDEIGFDAAQGEIIGLIGPNGAGKTTLFNLITGVIRPTSGSIAFAGQELTTLPPFRIARLGVSRTFQNIRVFKRMSAFENLWCAQHALMRAGWRSVVTGWTAKERSARDEAERMLALVGLEGKRDVFAENLTFGEQRMLEVARALVMRPQLLLLDEPAAGMVSHEIETFLTRIKALREGGLTIVIVEHHMNVIMRLCDRLVVLNFGRKIAEGPPATIQREAAVIDAYLGQNRASYA